MLQREKRGWRNFGLGKDAKAYRSWRVPRPWATAATGTAQRFCAGCAPEPAKWRVIPYYQPVIDLESGACLGVEVRARRQHPRRGLLELGAPISRAPRQSGAGTAPGRCPYADEAAGPLILLILIAQATCERSFPFGAFTNLA